MKSKTLGFIFSYLLEQWLTERKRGKIKIQKLEYLENKESFLDEGKIIFHKFLGAIICIKKYMYIKMTDTSFKSK